ncbi:MAG: transcriptional activator NhaR [Salinisphaeraceae bacterium]|nr:transcriptional activator NhaR [Salinisphaeraceae bacterium]
MQNINLKHLHYFWAVAHEGSIAAASERLFITPQTISAQLKHLESRLGQPLFHRNGKSLSLTRAGETALAYADQIFDLGKELSAALASEADGVNQLRVGISDVVPKLIASLILLPAIQHKPAPRLVCRESDASDLLARLGQHKLDIVISDHPAVPDPNLRLYNHEMGSTGISFMAAPGLVRESSRPFPENLQGLPILLPGRRTALRMTLETWLEDRDIRMRVAGEFDDSALTKAFGQIGAGVFTCPSAIEGEVSRQYAVKALGRTSELKESFYLISTSKQLSQPLVVEILERARRDVFLRSP